MRESEYQLGLIRRIRQRFPGCIILKNDSDYLQGVPDLLLLYKKCWAMLEVKASASSPTQPNQEYYVELAHELSFGAFIFPGNEEEVLDAIQQAFESRKSTRVSRAK